MSIAKTIIYGSVSEVAHVARNAEKIDVVDEYGYTPLIQTVICNDIEKLDAVLAAKPDVNFPDLTGRTALHWAADNNNYAICEKLLSAGADPNAYTLAGQPVLVMPLLRQHQRVKHLLYQYKADLNFAQDFINAKSLGHRFELEGRVDIVDTKLNFLEMEFEGFYLEFSLAMALSSFRDYLNHYAAKHWRDIYHLTRRIGDAFVTACELLKFQHYLMDIAKHRQQIDSLLHAAPLVIPVAFAGHAITLVHWHDILIRCDRGAYGRDHGTVIIYRIGNTSKFNRNFIKNLIYKRQDRHFIDDGLVQALDLTTITTLPLSVQISGNCSWANVEAVIPAMLYLLIMEESKIQSQKQIDYARHIAMTFFDEWMQWDQARALDFSLQSIAQCSPARKASKGAMLMAVMYQHFEYGNLDDEAKAERILKLLSQDDYAYIVKSYIKVFEKFRKTDRLSNVYQFLENYGIDVERFMQGF